LDRAEQDLFKVVRIGQEFVVIDFDDKGNLVGVLPRHHAEHAKGGSDGVAAAFDGEADDVFGVKVIGILGEAGAAGMFDALVNGEDGEIASAGEASVIVKTREIGEDAVVAVGVGKDAVYEIRTGEMQTGFGNLGIGKAEQGFGFGAQ